MKIQSLLLLKKYLSNIYTKAFIIVFIISTSMLIFYYIKASDLSNQINNYTNKEITLKNKLESVEKDLDALKHEDQYIINKKLEAEINNIQNTYQKSVKNYENLLDIKGQVKNTNKLDELFADSLNLLSQRNYSSAEAKINLLNQQIQQEKDKLTAASQNNTSQNIPASNTPPNAGYSKQTVQTDVGKFTVDIISADLSSTRVIVDTASDSDCGNNCPVLPLSDYVSRNGAYAGINGTYFCPASYPSCAGKTNSFDLLVMNKNKHYFNSDNNVYSVNPAFIILGSSVRFVSKAQEWGRDTGVDAVISNFPALVISNQIVYGGNDDPKFNSKGPRGFIANKGNTIYIGFVYNATMSDSAHVLKALNVDNAMNLDEGGSTALWYGGYKAGPGRNIPNAVLFLKK